MIFMNKASEKPEWKIIIGMLEKFDLVLLNRIMRRMFIHLYKHDVHDILDLMKELEPYDDANASRLYSNMPLPKIERSTLRRIMKEVFSIAANVLPEEEINNLVSIWLAQERSRFLSIACENENLQLDELKKVLIKFFTIPREEHFMSSNDFINIRVSLIKRFLSDHLKYINIAKNYILVRDFYKLTPSIIGPLRGTGRLGGKAAGLILASKIIEKKQSEYEALKDVTTPRSWFITSDITINFLHYNALEEMVSLKYAEPEQICASYIMLKQLFKNSFFPQEIVDQLQHMLEEIGNKPVIVRSSSLLEDSFQASFSGKYKSLFLANSGNMDDRLGALLDAMAEIMASVFSPDAIEYRKNMQLLDFTEQMGLLVQEVVGSKVGDYFFPLYAGVAFSYNEFRWSPRIEREDGMVRLVAGLGTRAVDRLTDDYPVLASPGKPGLRVNITREDQLRYSQKYIDVINLRTGRFESISLKEIVSEYGDQIEGISDIISIDEDGELKQVVPAIWDSSSTENIPTFNGLLDDKKFMEKLRAMLNALEDAYQCPVDVEFASNGSKLYLLQCRPQGQWGKQSPTSLPENIPDDNIIFTADRYVTDGVVDDFHHIVYVDPLAYSNLSSEREMQQIAKAVRTLNQRLPPQDFILMGPGRWGSRGDIKLGVQVTYSDINNTSMLIELAKKDGDYMPELSFGTHFFQDLVESRIKYLPIYLDENSGFLNMEYINSQTNFLSQWALEFADLSDVIKVIGDRNTDISMKIVMDGSSDFAMGWLVQNRQG
ncbi:MAG: PEP/pyruvate-binding domain-containing protein [Deltaproteobacteria bacterium]|nr:PEP/pyruvate-binding domain-containing protein [Deltaproteobacteria bacterium]